MTDYSELVKALRICGKGSCVDCDRQRQDKCLKRHWNNEDLIDGMLCEAAAAIEALIGTVGDLQAIRERLEEENDALRLEPKRGEIVRCRECRYRITAHGISDGWVLCSKPYTERGNAMHRADWFCADGEREVQE